MTSHPGYPDADHGQVGPVQAVITATACRQDWGQIRPSRRHPAATQVEPLQAALLGPTQAVTATRGLGEPEAILATPAGKHARPEEQGRRFDRHLSRFKWLRNSAIRRKIRSDVDAEGPDGLKDSNYGLSAARGSVADSPAAVAPCARLLYGEYVSETTPDGSCAAPTSRSLPGAAPSNSRAAEKYWIYATVTSSTWYRGTWPPRRGRCWTNPSSLPATQARFGMSSQHRTEAMLRQGVEEAVMVDTRLIDEPRCREKSAGYVFGEHNLPPVPGRPRETPKESGVTFVPSLRFHGVLPGATVVMPRALAAALRRLS